MTHERQVYLLDPQKIPPETIAVTFAKTSRSPESFRQIAAELTDQKSAEFNEKWVVGYGHSSVAEHAVLHIAVENVSRLAVECIESNRLASYTEKSTRYQTWSGDAFFIPEEWKNSPLAERYMAANVRLLDTYAKFIPVVISATAKQYPTNGTGIHHRVRTPYSVHSPSMFAATCCPLPRWQTSVSPSMPAPWNTPSARCFPTR